MSTRSLMYLSTRYGFTEKRKAHKPGSMFALASLKKQHKIKNSNKTRPKTSAQSCCGFFSLVDVLYLNNHSISSYN